MSAAPEMPDTGGLLESIPVALVDPNPDQVRTVFDPDDLAGLAQSIDEIGLLQPIVVRRVGDRYQLVMGERRLRAFLQLGRDAIPAIVRDTGDSSMRVEALLENLQRENLNPMELAAAYEALLTELGCTSEELAARLGVSYQTIRFHIRLLSMPAGVQRRLAAGTISYSHAKALAGLEGTDLMERFADRIVAEGWTVQNLVEQIALVRSLPAYGGASTPRKPAAKPRSRLMADWSSRLEAHLDTQVQVAGTDKGGRITIRYADAADLRRIAGTLGVPAPTAD